MIIPTATYRIQFRNGMDFDTARALVPYLQRLGISHLYASPIYRAVDGSTHGYDVVDHNEIDPALGGREAFERLSWALREAGIGILLDIVPNHMAASLENPWWRSVVAWGEESPYARHFDIDWERKLTLPILGRPYEEVLQADELSLVLDAQSGSLALAYFETRLPLHPGSWEPVLSWLEHPLAGRLVELAGQADPANPHLLVDAVRNLAADPEMAGLIQEMADRSKDARFVDAAHEQQPWQLTFWKDASRSLSYRRFFEVTGLAGVRVEDEQVFTDVHALTLELVRSGLVDGLRIDHVDGLADPAGYLARLREEVPDTYIVVEKILAEDEVLPPDWPVQGTTGYEFIDAITDLLADGEGVEALREAYQRATGSADVETLRREAKMRIATSNFEGELCAVASLLTGLAEEGTSGVAMRDTLAALIVAMPVYRTYFAGGGASAADRAVLDLACREALTLEPAPDPLLLDFVRDVLTGDHPAAATPQAELARTRFQQLSGPAMAKGVEDTLFYRDHHLLALNEVGGEPGREKPRLARFHELMQARSPAAPHALLATATHDTKRGEDARARLVAISEIATAWALATARWRTSFSDHVKTVDEAPAPEPEIEWMLFQALAGVWPDDLGTDDERGLSALRDRFLAYVEKALREAKLRTSWTETNEPYEAAVSDYVEAMLDPAQGDFLADFAAFIAPLRLAGRRNALAQTLVKLTAPGIPDIYQGTEAADLSLVDPDNRRPVDYRALTERLAGATTMPDQTQFEAMKQWVIVAALGLRKAQPLLFSDGDYLPLDIEGPFDHHLAAFARSHGDARLITVVPRLTLALSAEDGTLDPATWAETAIRLPSGWENAQWIDALTGETLGTAPELKARTLLARYPVALLYSEG